MAQIELRDLDEGAAIPDEDLTRVQGGQQAATIRHRTFALVDRTH